MNVAVNVSDTPVAPIDAAPGLPAGQPERDSRPNVVVVVLDDVGFAQLGCYGSDLRTPAIDALAAGGLRFNRFHVTSLCSPTRAALLTGRNHHKVGMGFVADFPLPLPGYSARIPPSAASLARLLGEAGYFSIAVGKWHLAPRSEHAPVPPFERWPLGMGFDRYFGFLGAKTNQWAPDLVEDNHLVGEGQPAGRHLTERLVDRCIAELVDLRNSGSRMPFFLYLAPAAMHSPHHVAPQWVRAYEGQFDGGWDDWRNTTYRRQLAGGVAPHGTKLTARPPWVQPWDCLEPDERRVYAAMQETFAGLMTHTDAEIGRLVEFLGRAGELDNTLIVLLSDNGASAEGGPMGSPNEYRYMQHQPMSRDELLGALDGLGGIRTYNHYPWGWAWAGNTPFRLWKRYSWLGGTRTPMIVHWPAAIDDTGAVRPQFCHVIDIMPTILDACGVEAPDVVDGIAQQPLQGATLRAAFDDPTAPSPRDTQYFEMAGSRAIYHAGWRATTDHLPSPIGLEASLVEGSTDFDADHWALFAPDDFSEADDVSAQHPDRVAEMIQRWEREAERNDVLPMTDTIWGRVSHTRQATPRPVRRQFLPGGGPVDVEAMPDLSTGGQVRVTLDGFGEPGMPHEGVLCTSGDWNNGFGIFSHDGVVEAVVSIAGALTQLKAPAACPSTHTGDCEVTLRLRPTADRTTLQLEIDGAPLDHAATTLTLSTAWNYQRGPLRIGYDSGLPMVDRYEPPFRWTGKIHAVEISAHHAAVDWRGEVDQALGSD